MGMYLGPFTRFHNQTCSTQVVRSADVLHMTWRSHQVFSQISADKVYVNQLCDQLSRSQAESRTNQDTSAPYCAMQKLKVHPLSANSEPLSASLSADFHMGQAQRLHVIEANIFLQ